MYNPILSQMNTNFHTIFLTSILTLSLCLLLGLPIGLFLSGFPTRIMHEFQISPMRATWPTHIILLDLKVKVVPMLN